EIGLALFLEFDSDHQTEMANVAHIGERMLFQLAGKVVALLFCLFVQFVVPHEIDGGAPGCADQWTSPKGAAVFPDRCLYLVRAAGRADRQSSADCFGEAEDVRFQVEVTARCGSGFWGGQRPSLAHYVTGMGPMDGATAAGGRSCCLSSDRAGRAAGGDAVDASPARVAGVRP